MKSSARIISVVLLLCVIVTCIVSCDLFSKQTTTTQSGEKTPAEFVDYVSQLKYDPNSNRAKLEVEVHLHIDGDTTHFKIKNGQIDGSNILKARYLGIDTPESTGAIEKWGKKASNFTKEKLASATSIIVESDTETWNRDSNGTRYMVWVWYKTSEMDEYTNLNLEILQAGLAKRKGSDYTYVDIFTNAYMQAQAHKLYVFGNDIDPDYYTGSAIPVDLKELASNPEKYEGKTVVFEGVVARLYSGSAYIQEYDEETGMYHGIGAYFGNGFQGESLLVIGNRLKIVGSVQFWEGGGTYQISDLKYYSWDPDNPKSIKLLSSGHEVIYTLTTPEKFCNELVDVYLKDADGEEVLKQLSYKQLALNTPIEMENLTVSRVYTTNNGGDSDGEMTLTCKSGNYTIIIRTAKLYDSEGNLITADYFMGKTISSVKGLVSYFNGEYQIRLINLNDVVVEE